MQKILPTLKVTTLALASLLPFAAVAQTAPAATKTQKMETCKAGADHDSLTGAKRNSFISKCMGTANYEPKARQDAMKEAKKKKPAATPAAAPPADEETEEKPQ